MSSAIPFEKTLKVFCVDDDAEINALVCDIITNVGFTPVSYSSPAEAIADLDNHLHQLILIISDFKMPQMTGLEFRERILASTKHLPFLMLSGYISRQDALEAVNLKIAGFLEKPLNPPALEALIRKETADLVASLKDDFEMTAAFLTDAEDLIEQMEDLLLALEAEPGNFETVNQIFAIAHTIKGSSGFLKPDTLHHFMHRYEDFLSHFKKNLIPVPPAAVSVLLKGLDSIRALIKELGPEIKPTLSLENLVGIFEVEKPALQSISLESGEAPASTAAHQQRSEQAQDFVRVPMQQLDHFMELSGEITVIRNMINKLVRSIEKAVPSNKDVSLLSELLDEMHKINGQMQEKVGSLRKVSMKTVFRPLPRALRDVATQLKKDIRIELGGENLYVDNAIADVLSNSLIHMVRNSADHAIEDPQTRTSKGKSPTGLLRISAAENRENIIVTIVDDGKGIHHEIIKKKALENKLITREQAAKMTVTELQGLIFESGFSTASQVTDVSGRGVGMDMVKKSVTKIAGRIDIDSTVDKGTKFTLTLPIPKSVNIIAALLVKCGPHMFCIPQEDIYRLISLSAEESSKLARAAHGAEFIEVDGHLCPLIDLYGELLAREKTTAGRALHRPPLSSGALNIVVVRRKSFTFGIVVDAILDMEEIVVKKLGKTFQGHDIFAGATFLGDGRVGLILRADGIAGWAGISDSGPSRLEAPATEAVASLIKEDQRNLVLFDLNRSHSYGILLDDVFRLEQFQAEHVQFSGRQAVVVYRGATLPLIDLAAEFRLKKAGSQIAAGETLPSIIVRSERGLVGFVVNRILDLQPVATIDTIVENQQANIQGAAIVADQTVTVVDTAAMIRRLDSQLRVAARSA